MTTTTYEHRPAAGAGSVRARSRVRAVARLALRAAGLLALLAALWLGLTADGRWLVRAGWEEGRILMRRRPIADLVRGDARAASALPAADRAKLALVLAARAYAVDSLGLDAGRSFTQYTDVGRDTLVLVLSAARRDTLAAVTWWFPVVGRVPYKGFFRWDQARRAAADLRAEGYDVYLRPASAFSTLGWFADPLLNTTLAADSVDLVNTVIHEITHQTYYAPNDAPFNESFASFVGARGAERFFRARGDTARAAEAVRRWSDERLLGRFWTSYARAVDSAYSLHPGNAPAARARRLATRGEVTRNARRLLADSIGPTLVGYGRSDPARLRRWAERIALDNAALLARRAYTEDLDRFDEILVREGELGRVLRKVIEEHRRRATDG